MENFEVKEKIILSRKLRRVKTKTINFFQTSGKQNIIILGALIALVAIFTIINPNYLDPFNILSVTQSFAPYAVLALGVTFVIATGGIDLSIGTVCIASAVIGGKLYMSGMPLVLTIPVMLLVGVVFGAINGLLIAKFKLPAFIATLGTMMLSRGLSALIVKIPNIFFPTGTWFNTMFSNLNGFPIGLVWVAGLTVISMYFMYKNKIGRYILSIGSNEEATRLSGINTTKYKMIAYIISGLFAGIAAIFWAASFPTVSAASGNGMELDAIAGVYIGGTSSVGGVASVVGSFIGSMLLVVIRTGLNFALSTFGLDLNSQYVTFVITGLIVVAAVLMDIIKKKNEQKVKILSPVQNIKHNVKEEIERLNLILDVAVSDKALKDKDEKVKAEAMTKVASIKEEIENLKLDAKGRIASLK